MNRRLPNQVTLRQSLLTPGVICLSTLFFVGLAIGLYRFIFGLAAVTNLNNQYPFGIWIGVDMAGGVALAAGGFTTAALIHVFHREHYEVIGRPAHLTAMLGYTFAVLGLLFDLGRWYNIWHPMLPPLWQGNSVMFEVAMCVMLYLTVLYIEFLPVVLERFDGAFSPRLNRVLQRLQDHLSGVMWFFIILGIVLSCLHQSSLGNMMVIAPYKMHPLWYTPILPWLFLSSAVALGFPMVIFESLVVSKTLKRELEMDILGSLAKWVPILISVYFFSKIIDLTIRDAWGYLWEFSLQSNMFLLEVVLGLVVPLFLFFRHQTRRSPNLLLTASALYVFFGVLLNRVNVFLIAYQPPYSEGQYIPTLAEVMVTVGLISGIVLFYRIIVTFFPVLPRQPSHP